MQRSVRCCGNRLSDPESLPNLWIKWWRAAWGKYAISPAENCIVSTCNLMQLNCICSTMMCCAKLSIARVVPAQPMQCLLIFQQ